jgi:alpha-ketoglutarate-dependent taurine dioxygenase
METATLPEVHKTGGLIGAEIRGLDLTREYPDKTYEAVRQAWAENGVIFLRDQHLNDEQRERFATRFGTIRVKQELRKEPEQTRAIGEGWHTDMTCFDEPPVATMLFAEEIPPWGGDTQWAGMGPAFEALSPGLQRTLLGLRAVHSNVRKLGLSYAQTDPPEPSIAEYDAAEGPVHPVVRLIPETGRSVLYVNPEFTMRFEGWTRRESLPLLRYLFEFGSRPEFVTRFHWAPGSVAMWDNRQTWHFAVNDYQGQRRVMHRLLLAGTKPIPAGS